MRVAAMLVLFALTGCGGNMVQQPRDDAYEDSQLFADGKVMQLPPDGTVSRDAAVRALAAQRPPLTAELLARGRERYGIYCAVCHGAAGRGDGFVTTRGFPPPPSYLESRLRAAPAAHFYDVISNGYGVMYSYADRVEPADRWAIAAYIRVLQSAQPQRDAPHAR
jgi:mono/diheme cytochrome c family protein